MRFIEIQKCLEPNKIKFTMSGIQSKIIRHANRQEIMTQDEVNINRNLYRKDTDVRISREEK